MIEIKQLSKSFGDVRAVENLSFTAPDARITTLLGANGCGKSTTLRMLGGLMKPDSGEAIIDGHTVATEPMEARRKLGMFGDQFGLYPRLTAQEHLEFFGGFHNLSGKALRHAVNDVAELLDMKPLLKRRTEGFSQGQRMKVALGRTLIHKPPNLVLDEPTRGLDVISMRMLRKVLANLRDDGCCVLFSSHVMAEVEELSDHIILMSNGKLVFSGNANEVKSAGASDNLEDAFIQLTRAA